MNRIEVTLFMTKNEVREHGLPNLETIARMGARFSRSPSGTQYATITCSSLNEHFLGDWETVARWKGWIHAVEYYNGISTPFDIRARVRELEVAA